MSDQNLFPYKAPGTAGAEYNPAKTLEGLGAGALGAGNALLFGLPEAALKSIGDEKQRQIVEAYKTAHPEYGMGETVGTIGSALIPGAGQLGTVAKIAGKLGAKPVAELLTKGSEFLAKKGGTLREMALRGAGEGAVQAVPRAFGSQAEGQDLTQRITNASIGTGLGAGVGALGRGLTKIGETGVGKTVKDEVGKWFEDAVLSSSDVTRATLTKEMNETSRRLGINRVGNTFNNVDDLKKRTADFIIDKNLFNKLKREDLLSDTSPRWQKAADDYNKNPVDFTDQSIIDKIRNDPAVIEFANHSSVGQNGVDDTILEMINNLDPYKTSFNNAKSFLQKEAMRGRKAEDVRGEAKTSIANTMHDIIDDHALTITPELAELRSEYPIIKLLKRASATEKLGIDAPATTGSETFARLGAGGLIGLGGASQVPEDQKLQMIAAGMAAPFVAKAGGKLTQQALGSLAGKVMRAGESGAPLKMAESQASISPTIVQSFMAGQNQAPPTIFEQMTPMPAPNLVPSVDNVTPKVEPQATKANYSAPAEAPDQAQKSLRQGLETAWSIEDPRGLIEQTQPGSREAFFNDVAKAITNEDGSINYNRAAKILFPSNPDEQKHFSESYQTLSKIKEGIADVVNPYIINDPAAQLRKDTVRNALIEYLKSAPQSKFDQKGAESAVDNILGNGLKLAETYFRSPQQKALLIQKLLETADPVAFGENGLLKRAGVLR